MRCDFWVKIGLHYSCGSLDLSTAHTHDTNINFLILLNRIDQEILVSKIGLYRGHVVSEKDFKLPSLPMGVIKY